MSKPKQPRPVLVGVDGTDESLHACDLAYQESVRRGSTLLLVHAYLPVISDAETGIRFGEAEMRQEGHRLLRDAAKHVRRLGADDAHVDVRLSKGRFLKVIAEETRGTALVVVGRRPRLGEHLLPGSKAIGLAAAAHCPLVVVPPEFALTRRGKVVVGVDSSHRSAEAIRFAFTEAELRKTALVAVHAWQLPGHAMTSESQGVWRSQGCSQAERVLAVATEDMRREHPDVEVVLLPVEGRVAESLLAHVTDAELLVVGTRGEGGAPHMSVGSVTRNVRNAADVPIAAVRQRPVRPG